MHYYKVCQILLVGCDNIEYLADPLDHLHIYCQPNGLVKYVRFIWENIHLISFSLFLSHIHTCIHAHTHTQTRTRAHIHTHTHTQTHMTEEKYINSIVGPSVTYPQSRPIIRWKVQTIGCFKNVKYLVPLLQRVGMHLRICIKKRGKERNKKTYRQ